MFVAKYQADNAKTGTARLGDPVECAKPFELKWETLNTKRLHAYFAEMVFMEGVLSGLVTNLFPCVEFSSEVAKGVNTLF